MRYSAPASSMLVPTVGISSKNSLATTTQSIRSFHLTSPHRSGGTGDSAVMHWNIERAVSCSLVVLIPAAFVVYHPILDYALSTVLVLHAHWGLHACVVDYCRPKVIGAPIAKVLETIVYCFSALAFGGIMYFNYNDVGLINAVSGFWKAL